MNNYGNKQYENNDISVFKMYEKTSKAGNVYFSGTLGSCRCSLVKSKFTTDDGTPVWTFRLSPSTKNNAQQQNQQPQQQQRPVSKPVQQPRVQDEDEDFLSEFVG